MTDVESFYDRSAQQEWERLARHRTEFAVTVRALEERLPAPPAAVLDVGGGPGRYAIELAGRGYRVTLLDLSRGNLDLAAAKAREAGVSLVDLAHDNGLDLGRFVDAGFAAVLLMGPLYHLLREEERVKAVTEALRVLEPGGRLFAAFITRFAPFRYAARDDPAWYVEHEAYGLRLLETGLHTRTPNFAASYYVRPEEVTPLMEGCGLRTLDLLGCEGVVAGHEEGVNALEGDAWRAILLRVMGVLWIVLGVCGVALGVCAIWKTLQ